ncbi:hypothetical protein TW95_gp0959 [Pandoravirus inopinatum]|uniref:Uncharacterized protein n=1 Tax=Pandoravirus inopinatum TaxID=1605721 RepID=A0A0B5IY10_9VIRU|nr:hypothetical protein TW95_gp0959 [Pandoravirus inopinatum]AJF97693.1 hypothetical protein [Pandoravirus inopinatum]
MNAPRSPVPGRLAKPAARPPGELFNRNGARMCDALGCRRHARVVQVYRGLFVSAMRPPLRASVLASRRIVATPRRVSPKSCFESASTSATCATPCGSLLTLAGSPHVPAQVSRTQRTAIAACKVIALF